MYPDACASAIPSSNAGESNTALCFAVNLPNHESSHGAAGVPGLPVGVGDGAVVMLLSTYQVGDLPADADGCGAAAYVHKEDFGPSLVQDVWSKRGAA